MGADPVLRGAGRAVRGGQPGLGGPARHAGGGVPDGVEPVRGAAGLLESRGRGLRLWRVNALGWSFKGWCCREVPKDGRF
ncbi:hypothetical protein FH715_25525 [Streptomyces sedi]|uniref:Uncharacterized protein n=1 Tax=Streptomyces sedi TaxID=555059 RepID=A0A5C4UR50_9ACTN|nr:hypothetical protein FH715_25525 [Streptomyces sedi]